MLSTVLRHRAWPLLVQTKLLRLQRTLQICHAARPHSILSVRCFSSTLSGAEGDLSGPPCQLPSEEAAGKAQGRSRAYKEKILLAFQTYKEMHGDLIVPQSFVVPVGDARWLREVWGYKLGNAMSYLRLQLRDGNLPADFVGQLEKLRFVQSVLQFRWEEVIMPAFRHFHALHGHADVPALFVVPASDDSWPELSRGWRLGRTVSAIRMARTYNAQVLTSREELERMDFCFSSISERDWTQKIIPSLKVFREVFGHCIVEQRFKVPSSPQWPKKAWGKPLGIIVNKIRRGESYAEQATRDHYVLEQLDFAWDRDLWTWNKCTIPAMKVCIAQNGHLPLSQRFFVPKQVPWPKSAWGMNLGHQLYAMKHIGSFFAIIGRDVDRLQELGFSFELSERAWKKCVSPLLDIYAAISGDKDVPNDIVIPSEAPWPECMWEVALGFIVSRNSHHLINH